jgi:hypothetical protein
MMPRSNALRHLSTIRITSASLSTTIAGGSDWPKANRSTMILKSGLRDFR